jgi:hypothetical protein
MSELQCHVACTIDLDALSAPQQEMLRLRAAEHARRAKAQQDLLDVEAVAVATAVSGKSKKARVEKENVGFAEFLRERADVPAALPRMLPLPGAKKAPAPKPARSALDFFQQHLAALQDKAGGDFQLPSKIVLETRFAALSDVERRDFAAKAMRDEKRFADANALWKGQLYADDE